MFFQNYWGWLNQQLAQYLTGQLAALSAAIEPLVVIMATIMLMVWGYLLMSGRIDRPLEDTLHRLVRLMVILGACIKLWGINDVLIDWFVNGPSDLMARLTNNADPVTALDKTWEYAANVASFLMNNASFWDGQGDNYLWGIFLYLISGYFCLYLMFLLSLSKIAITVVLALAPIFIASLLFESTKGYFSSWIHELVNFFLVTVLSSFMLSLLTTLVTSYAQQTAAIGPEIKETDTIDLLLSCGLSILVLHQIIPIAARLSGGYHLQLGQLPQQAVRSGVQAAKSLAVAGLTIATDFAAEAERD